MTPSAITYFNLKEGIYEIDSVIGDWLYNVNEPLNIEDNTFYPRVAFLTNYDFDHMTLLFTDDGIPNFLNWLKANRELCLLKIL